MAEIDHFTYGLITPGLAYALSVLGSLLGLTCTAKARSADSAGRRAWFLLLAAWAIGGTGIWVMHFMAMLGFGVDGSEIRYDVPLTTASAIIAITVVAVGLYTAGIGRPTPLKIILGGTFAGLGVASMHYTGMAAMQINGTVNYDNMLVAASIAIAVVAATVALWFTVAVRKPIAIIGSALVMGVAVCGMHYTGMYAMEVHVHGTEAALTGSTAFGLILPIVLLVIFVVIGLIYAVLTAPTDEDRAGAAYLDARIANRAAPRAAPAGTPGGLAAANNNIGAAFAARGTPAPPPGPPTPPAPAGPGAPAGPPAPGAPAPAAPAPAAPVGPGAAGAPGAQGAPGPPVTPGPPRTNGSTFPTPRRQVIPRASARRRSSSIKE
jgi:NO-binding membrane sensor protein with MHYT domain